jgi:hypothetical protein
VFDNGVWGIVVPGFNQALYVNTGSINSPVAQWNINPPLGSVAPTGVYTYANPAWQFGTDSSLTLPTGGTVSYTPATSTDWSGTPPATMQEAIDRLAAAIKNLNGTGA